MYETRERFSLRDIFLQVLFVVLFIFIMIWLFPTKGYLETKIDKMGESVSEDVRDELKPLFTRLYTENMTTMKDAAKSYFTESRLPANIGDKVTLTLKEMRDLNIILPLIDANNKECDINRSYVEVTKMDDEYVMKINLSCSDNDAYVLEYLGCYNYCNGTICSREDGSTPVSNDKYKYQYKLVSGGSCNNWSNWSGWTENVITANNYTQVETSTKQVFSHYEQVWGIVKYETKEEKVQEEVAHETSNESKREYTSYKTETNSSTVYKDYTIKKVESGSKWEYQGLKEYKSTKSTTSSYKYTLVSTRKELDCSSACKTVNYYTYKVYKKVTTYTNKKVCPSGYELTSDKTKCYKIVTSTENVCPSGYNFTSDKSKCYKDVTVEVKKCPANSVETDGKCMREVIRYVETPVYGWIQGNPVYKDVKIYRSRTKTCTGSTVNYKWSTSNNDQSLLNQGYVLTGLTEKI